MQLGRPTKTKGQSRLMEPASKGFYRAVQALSIIRMIARLTCSNSRGQASIRRTRSRFMIRAAEFASEFAPPEPGIPCFPEVFEGVFESCRA